MSLLLIATHYLIQREAPSPGLPRVPAERPDPSGSPNPGAGVKCLSGPKRFELVPDSGIAAPSAASPLRRESRHPRCSSLSPLPPVWPSQ